MCNYFVRADALVCCEGYQTFVKFFVSLSLTQATR
jgi:hypothetical protein